MWYNCDIFGKYLLNVKIWWKECEADVTNESMAEFFFSPEP